MWTRIATDVRSKIARTAVQGKAVWQDVCARSRRLIAHKHIKQDVGMALAVLCVIVGSWCLGRLSGEGEAPKVILVDVFADARERFVCAPVQDLSSSPGESQEGKGNTGSAPIAAGAVVGSKNGIKYHLQSCSGVKSIKEENKVWFASEAAAQAAGYTRAGNCK